MGEENGAVDAVHEVEVEFDGFGRVLGCCGVVDCDFQELVSL